RGTTGAGGGGACRCTSPCTTPACTTPPTTPDVVLRTPGPPAPAGADSESSGCSGSGVTTGGHLPGPVQDYPGPPFPRPITTTPGIGGVHPTAPTTPHNDGPTSPDSRPALPAAVDHAFLANQAPDAEVIPFGVFDADAEADKVAMTALPDLDNADELAPDE